MLGRDPVALKELRGVSRRWHTYVGRCLFVGITAALLYQYWKENWVSHDRASVTVSQYAMLGRAIFERCDAVGLVLTVLAAVMAGAEMIAREFRAGTLPLLLLTPLTPHRVVFGKWKAAMTIAVALYLCSVPVLAISVYLGGVGPDDLARSAAFTLGLAAAAGAAAIWCSARLKSTGAAAAAAIPIALVLYLLFWAVDQTRSGVTHRGGIAVALLAVFCVAAFLRAAVRRVKVRTGAIESEVEHARELRTLALDELREARGIRPQRLLIGWRAVWEGNPLLWKEFTLRPASRLREEWRTRSYVFLYFFFLVSWLVTAYRNGDGFFALWGCFFAVVAISGGCLLFAPEKEGRQWLLLLSTPVTPAQIVRAKLFAGLIFPEALGLLALYVLAMLAWVGFERFEVLFQLVAATTLFLLFCYSLAAAASLRVRTARTAFLFSAGVVAALVVLPSLISGAFRPLAGTQPSIWTEAWNWFEALDPVTVFSRLEVRDSYRTSRSLLAYEGLLRYFAIYLPLTLLLPVEMILRFRKIALHA